MTKNTKAPGAKKPAPPATKKAHSAKPAANPFVSTHATHLDRDRRGTKGARRPR